MNDQRQRKNSVSNTKPLLLLVEDEEDTAILVKLIMESEGYDVVHAEDGQMALTLIDTLEPPSLVLLDVQLPHADGVTLLEAMRARPDWRSVPVVMLTADGDQRVVLSALALGAKDYILKPFVPDTLISRLRRFRIAA